MSDTNTTTTAQAVRVLDTDGGSGIVTRRPVTRGPNGSLRCGTVGDGLFTLAAVEVRVTIETRHYVTAAAAAEIERDYANGVRGAGPLGVLLTESRVAATQSRGVESVTVEPTGHPSGWAFDTLVVGGWEAAANAAADRAVPVPGQGGVGRWAAAWREGHAAARQRDGFTATEPSAR